MEKLKILYKMNKNNNIVNKNNNIGHPSYWLSKGYTERNLKNILNNSLDDNFIKNHISKLSKKHHTYDNFIKNHISKLSKNIIHMIIMFLKL